MSTLVHLSIVTGLPRQQNLRHAELSRGTSAAFSDFPFLALNTPNHLEAAILSKPKQPPQTKPEACSGRELAVKAPLAVLMNIQLKAH